MEITGTVVFHRGEIKSGKEACICCGAPDIPHAHIFGEYMDFPAIPSLFPGLKDMSIEDYLHRFIHLNKPEIEGKTVRVTFEIRE